MIINMYVDIYMYMYVYISSLSFETCLHHAVLIDLNLHI